MLLSPANGMVDFNGTVVGSVARYECESERFRVVPESSRMRTCGTGNWNGEEPVCGKWWKMAALMWLFGVSTSVSTGNK